MTRVHWVSCCAAVAIFLAAIPIIAVGQIIAAEEDPFGGIVEQIVEREPTLAIDPAPADENAASAKAEPAATAPQDSCRCLGSDTLAPSVANIRQALRQPLKESGMEYVDQPLEEVVNMIQQEYGIPVKFDTTAMNELGKSVDEPINVNLHDISLRAALNLMLEQHGLTYVIRDEVLMVTTPDEAEQHLQTCVYDVRDLIQAKDKEPDFDSLIDAIASTVATETWAENGGGEAQIRPMPPGLLIISQTHAVHDEIRGLLDAIRQTKAQPMRDAPAAAAAAIEAAPPVDASDAKVVTRSYFLQISQPAGGDSFASQIRELITKSLPDEQWAGRLDNGEPVVLTVLPDRIVLRHRETVQDKVQSLLKDSAIAYPASAVGRGKIGDGGIRGGLSGSGTGTGGVGFFNPGSAENQ